VANVERLVIDPLSPSQIEQLRDITSVILNGLDPERHFPTRDL